MTLDWTIYGFEYPSRKEALDVLETQMNLLSAMFSLPLQEKSPAEIDALAKQSPHAAFMMKAARAIQEERVTELRKLSDLSIGKLLAIKQIFFHDAKLSEPPLKNMSMEVLGEVMEWREEIEDIKAFVPSNDSPAEESEAQFDFEMATDDERIEWLSERGPKDWHETVLAYNWDWGAEAIMPWISSQPRCDSATALQIFLLCSPSEYAKYGSREEVKSYNQWTYDLVHDIYAKLLSGYYPTKKYRLHDNGSSLRNYLQRQARAESENKPSPFQLPVTLVEGLV